ncbi:CDP-glycerol glycerophosphotransferase family protein [Camelliibacillus cellulosilyticus]|uniref:CDP-glycerol glycerophosphotransferase family protein n=1 Tax=Camelliibacillus cellulosilyticus TaxID=2174486 RepID=A0ABV9GQ13_9BACL
MNLLAVIKRWLSWLVMFVFQRFPIKNNKIFFMNYYGSGYGCNPKYMTEYLLNHYPKGTFDVVWAFNDIRANDHLTGFRQVKTMSWRYFFDCCTAKVIVTNFRTTDAFVKRRGQYYIQTWHSSLRLKQIEKDAEKTLPAHYVRMAKRDSNKIDLLISGCAYGTAIFRRAFWYSGEIMTCGTPRNDLFFQRSDSVRKRIFDRLGLSRQVKVMLYAPTFRSGGGFEVYQWGYQNLLNKAKERFGGEWVFLVKHHPHLSAEASRLESSDRVIDVTAYDDTQELLSIADILVTDYSSLMFDFALTRRPCFLYVPDLDTYVKKDRNLYFDLKRLPFISARSEGELIQAIDGFQADVYETRLKSFLAEIGTYESGGACPAIFNRIETVCFGSDQITRGVRHEAV